MQISHCERPFVCSFEVLGECNLHIDPTMDRFGLKIIETLPCCSSEHEREVSNCNVCRSACNSHCLEIILQPGTGLFGSILGLECFVKAKAYGVLHFSDPRTETERTDVVIFVVDNLRLWRSHGGVLRLWRGIFLRRGFSRTNFVVVLSLPKTFRKSSAASASALARWRRW